MGHVQQLQYMIKIALTACEVVVHVNNGIADTLVTVGARDRSFVQGIAPVLPGELLHQPVGPWLLGHVRGADLAAFATVYHEVVQVRRVAAADAEQFDPVLYRSA